MGKVKSVLSEKHIINGADIYIGNSNNMSQIPDNSVNLIITSPPYWTLKDYDTEEQIS